MQRFYADEKIVCPPRLLVVVGEAHAKQEPL